MANPCWSYSRCCCTCFVLVWTKEMCSSITSCSAAGQDSTIVHAVYLGVDQNTLRQHHAQHLNKTVLLYLLFYWGGRKHTSTTSCSPAGHDSTIVHAVILGWTKTHLKNFMLTSWTSQSCCTVGGGKDAGVEGQAAVPLHH